MKARLYLYSAIATTLALPHISFAAQTAQEFIGQVVLFLNNIVIPFLLGIAFLIFIINVVRYFILGAGQDESRQKAKSLALYTVLGFVLIVIFWGIVNLLSNGLGFAGADAPTPDYYNTFDFEAPSRPASSGDGGTENRNRPCVIDYGFGDTWTTSLPPEDCRAQNGTPS